MVLPHQEHSLPVWLEFHVPINEDYDHELYSIKSKLNIRLCEYQYHRIINIIDSNIPIFNDSRLNLVQNSFIYNFTSYGESLDLHSLPHTYEDFLCGNITSNLNPVTVSGCPGINRDIVFKNFFFRCYLLIYNNNMYEYK